MRLALGAGLWLVIITVSLLSCGAPEPHIRVESGFSTDEMNQIARAARAWNQVVYPEHRIAFESDGYWVLLHAKPPGLSQGWIGETDNGPGTVWIWPGIRPEWFYRVVLHELGHTLGLEHITGFAVMNPYVNAEYITDRDVAECQSLGLCPSSIDETEKLKEVSK